MAENYTFDLTSFFRFLWREKNRLLLGIMVAFLLGWGYTFTWNSEFVSTSKILPEIPPQLPKPLSGVANLVESYGFDAEAINTQVTKPDIFVEISRSKTFLRFIAEQPVMGQQKVLYKDYFKKSLAKSSLFSWGSDAIINDEEVADDLLKRITVTYGKKSKVIDISVKMPHAVVAHEVATLTLNYLTGYVTKYRTLQATRHLRLLEKLASAPPGPKKVNFPGNLAELSSLITLAKIRLNEETPVIQILDQPEIPVRPAKSRKIVVMGLFMLAGFISTLGYLALTRKNYKLFIV